MIKFRGNWLLLQVALIYAGYAAMAFFVPRPYVASAVSILALMAGFLLLSRYIGKALDILLRMERGEFGGHNSILGATEMSSGVVYSGMFRLLWVYFGQPETWVSTGLSSLGLFMIAKGAYRLALSPGEVEDPHKFPSWFWSRLLWIFGLIIAFLLGTHFSSFG